MKLKLRMMIVLSSLLITSHIPIFASTPTISGNLDDTSEYSANRRSHKHKVHIATMHKKHWQRSILSSSAYIEDNILYLYFSSPLENVSLEITNVDTGTVIFSGKFTGTSLIIPLQEDGYEFIINVN